MKKGFLAGLVVLVFALGGCGTLSFGQLGSAFSKVGDVLSDECADVPTSEVKNCLAALKDKVTEDEAVE
ncbi:hypothetical protein LCGC14_0209380 [marine sediment metagenome]|uniref:Lipoprotein n=1 Tax=marine sediment metagenome TaxID=412755 RepID=A0A0F9UY61_9ZZZZ